MDAAGLKNIRGTLHLVDEALISHLADAVKEADRLRDSVDRELGRTLDVIDQLEDAQAFVRCAVQRISSALGKN